MQTIRRDLMKTLSFAGLHFGVALTVAYALTGSVAVATGIGLIEPIANTVKDVKSRGNTVTWFVVCKEGTSTGKITYAGTTMEGFIETTVKTNGGTMTMKSTMKGKRIGPCK